MKAWMQLVCLGALVIAVSGCSRGWDITYEPPEPPAGAVYAAEARPNVAITVHEFRDVRPDPSHVGAIVETGAFGVQRTTYHNTMHPVGTIVADAIAKQLEHQGFTVVRSHSPLNPSTLRNVATELALGGEVKAFLVRQVDRRSLPGHLAGGIVTTANVNIAVQVVTKDGELIWEGDLVGNRTHDGYQILGIGGADPKTLLQEALADAVNELQEPHVRDQLMSHLSTGDKIKLALVTFRF